MKLTIQAFKKKDIPLSSGKIFSVYSAKFNGQDNPEWGFDLKGFSKGTYETLKVGQTIMGKFDTEFFTKKDGSQGSKKVFRALNVDDLYELIMRINPQVESLKPYAEDVDPNFDEGIHGPDSEVAPDDNLSPGW